jgi:hypothetical protein
MPEVSAAGPEVSAAGEPLVQHVDMPGTGPSQVQDHRHVTVWQSVPACSTCLPCLHSKKCP